MNDTDARILIVEAGPDDIRFAYELGVEFHEESAEAASMPPLDPARVYAVLNECQKNRALFIAVDVEQELPVGVLAMTTMDYWYSSDLFATDLIFFVSKAGRVKGGAAKRLLERAKEWAGERDMTLMMAVTAAGRVEAKDNFFKRRGLTRVGGIYVMGAR